MTTAHPHHDRDARAGELRRRVLARERVRLDGLPAGGSYAPRDRRVPVGARLHARLRDDRALPGPGRVPVRVNPLKLAFAGQAVHRELHAGSRTSRHALPGLRPGDGEQRGTDETDAFFGFHHVNAFEDGGELVIDLCYDDASIIDSLDLAERPAAARFRGPSCAATGPRRRGRARGAAVRGRGAPADRLRAPQHAPLPLRVRAGAGDGLARPARQARREGGDASMAQDGCYPGEPVFVREPGARPRTTA